MHRKRIPMRALCAIARAVITADPFIDNFDWTESTKRELLRQGWDYPRPEDMASALARVERALTKEWGPRPLPATRPPPAAAPASTPDASPWQLPRAPSTQSATFTPAIGEQGQLVEALDRYAPEALAAVRRAAQSPEVKAAIARARQRIADARAQPQPPGRMAVLALQRALLLAQAARDARRKTLPHRRAAAEGTTNDQATNPEEDDHATSGRDDDDTDGREKRRYQGRS